MRAISLLSFFTLSLAAFAAAAPAVATVALADKRDVPNPIKDHLGELQPLVKALNDTIMTLHSNKQLSNGRIRLDVNSTATLKTILTAIIDSQTKFKKTLQDRPRDFRKLTKDDITGDLGDVLGLLGPVLSALFDIVQDTATLDLSSLIKDSITLLCQALTLTVSLTSILLSGGLLSGLLSLLGSLLSGLGLGFVTDLLGGLLGSDSSYMSKELKQSLNKNGVLKLAGGLDLLRCLLDTMGGLLSLKSIIGGLLGGKDDSGGFLGGLIGGLLNGKILGGE